MFKNPFIKKWSIPVIAIIASVVCLTLLGGHNLWMDEAFSAVLVRNVSFSQMLKASADDTLPPLYNILNWCLVTLLGFKPWVLRLTSVVPIIMCIFLGATVVRKRFGDFTSFIFILCICGMPALPYYMTEIRMYALSLFMVTLCGIFAIEAYYDMRFNSWVIFTFATLGAAYTHHFAFVACGFVHLSLIIALFLNKKKRLCLRFWVYAILAIAIMYIPCMFSTLNQISAVNGYFTMPDISKHFVIQCIKLPFTTNMTALSVLLILFFVLINAVSLFFYIKETLIMKNISGKNIPFPAITVGSLIFLGIMTFGIACTKLLSANIFSERYLVPSLGLLWLGFAISVSKLCTDNLFPKKLSLAIAVAISLFVFIISTVLLQYQYTQEYDSRVDQMTDFFAMNVKKIDGYIIYEGNHELETCFKYYFPTLHKTIWKNIDEIKGNVWYVEAEGFESSMKNISENGYNSIKIGDFGFDRYNFSLYLLSRK